MDDHLIPEHAKRTLAESDARKAEARKHATAESFRQSFTSSFARDIELIRRGAIVTDVDSEGRVLAVKMPDGKPVPTKLQARWSLKWARFTRFLRAFFASFSHAYNVLIHGIRSAWKRW